MGRNITVSGGSPSLPRPHLHGCSRCSRCSKPGRIPEHGAGWARAREAQRAAGEGRTGSPGLVAGRHSPGPRSPARQPGAVRRGAEHLKRPPCAVGRPAGADWFCRRAQLEGNWAGGRGRTCAPAPRAAAEPWCWGGGGPSGGAPQPAAGSRSGNSCPGCQARRGREVQSEEEATTSQ